MPASCAHDQSSRRVDELGLLPLSLHAMVYGCHMSPRAIGKTTRKTSTGHISQSITGDHVKDFLWKHVVCRHGIPYEIVTDNGTNLMSSVVQKLCDDWGIRLTPSTPQYPQGNGQAEAANKLILHGLKRQLGAAKSGWDAQLPGVLWATKLPLEVVHAINDEALLDNLTIIDEKREQALVRAQNYHNSIARFYNSKVRLWNFIIGERVLRKVFDHKKEKNAGKMGTKWEGAYRITEIVRNGVYHLVDESNGKAEPRPWNIMNLKKYF
ncbi:PREDICTED: uncharacterized protein LOC104738264 [Camelina sativa]|uniref:Uncharacterized protein LOC104738264 n=1 Tax=Camelina sativa TaxID=90675 RepID=A0ABM0VIM3_CAMSA|nr:PREDICTED: uncharacterized protein LOC104738264 [Camelina sativa]